VEETLMAKILALTSRLPYPPREGHQLRSWHVLRALAREHEVTLLSFLRDDDALENTAPLREVVACLETFQIPSERSCIALGLALMRGVLGRDPFVVHKYASEPFRARVSKLLTDVDIVHVDMLPLASLVGDTDKPIVLNAHNVEHELLERRIDIELRPLHRIFLRTQAPRLKTFEAATCRRAARILACSDNDAKQLASIAPATQITVVPNGVDTSAIQPATQPPQQTSELIFVGQMSWFPNRDGIEWFFADIFPRIQKKRPDAQFVLVGKNAGLHVPAAIAANVKLLGFVDDLVPPMQNAAVYVVPLRAGSGTRLKVLEAMAFGKAIVTTRIGSEGIDLQPDESAVFADSAEDFASAVVRVMSDSTFARRLGEKAREHAMAHYDWNAVTATLLPVYAGLLDRAYHA
jgi:glycosyltransferase involved in cell wall biosynthesis